MRTTPDSSSEITIEAVKTEYSLIRAATWIAARAAADGGDRSGVIGDLRTMATLDFIGSSIEELSPKIGDNALMPIRMAGGVKKYADSIIESGLLKDRNAELTGFMEDYALQLLNAVQTEVGKSTIKGILDMHVSYMAGNELNALMWMEKLERAENGGISNVVTYARRPNMSEAKYFLESATDIAVLRGLLHIDQARMLELLNGYYNSSNEKEQEPTLTILKAAGTIIVRNAEATRPLTVFGAISELHKLKQLAETNIEIQTYEEMLQSYQSETEQPGFSQDNSFGLQTLGPNLWAVGILLKYSGSVNSPNPIQTEQDLTLVLGALELVNPNTHNFFVTSLNQMKQMRQRFATVSYSASEYKLELLHLNQAENSALTNYLKTNLPDSAETYGSAALRMIIRDARQPQDVDIQLHQESDILAEELAKGSYETLSNQSRSDRFELGAHKLGTCLGASTARRSLVRIRGSGETVVDIHIEGEEGSIPEYEFGYRRLEPVKMGGMNVTPLSQIYLDKVAMLLTLEDDSPRLCSTGQLGKGRDGPLH